MAPVVHPGRLLKREMVARKLSANRLSLDIALVDYLGGLAEGRLVRGDNPVLMTMELVLEVEGEGT